MSILSRILYSLWYFRNPPWDSGVTPPEFLEYLQKTPAGSAIDLGCGTGTNAITLTRLGWQVIGVDFVPKAIGLAKKKAQRAGLNIDFRTGDVTRLDDIQRPLDLALDLGCFHSLNPKEKSAYLNQLSRILKPGGDWFLYAFLNLSGEPGAMGLTQAELDAVQSAFTLRSRIDGLDRGVRSSAYFIFSKPLASH